VPNDQFTMNVTLHCEIPDLSHFNLQSRDAFPPPRSPPRSLR